MIFIYNVRKIGISITASIFTLFISFYWLFSRTILYIFGFLPFNLVTELSYSLQKCNPHKITTSYCIQILVNSCISMASALIIANYTQKFIDIIGLISHQTHTQFLSLVKPEMPELWVYRPQFLVDIYIYLGYLGLSAQLAFTLDMIYIFTIPTILIYKLLALAYKLILKSIIFSYQILTRDPEKWITCEYKWLLNSTKCVKVLALGVFVILVEALVFVSFYYLWLAIVILILTTLLNIITIIKNITKSLGTIISIVKGHQKHGKKSNILILWQELKKSPVPILTPIMIRDVFKGKDLMQVRIRKIEDYEFSVRKVFSVLIDVHE